MTTEDPPRTDTNVTLGIVMTTVNLTTESSTEGSLINNVAVQISFYVLYSIIFLLGISGNILVCYIVHSNKAMQTVTNLFITNLTLSDILLCVTCVPFTPFYTFNGSLIFGGVSCNLVAYVQATSTYITTLTLTAIAIDRFLVILHPTGQGMKFKTCSNILLGIWLFSISVTLPYGIHMKVHVHEGKFVCQENWPIENLQNTFHCWTLILQFIIPFCIIIYCYIRISVRLNERARAKPGSKIARLEEADKEKKRRTNRMLVAIVVIFAICWFPINLIKLTNHFSYPEIVTDTHLLFFSAQSLAMFSTCYKPILCAWLNENFRREFRRVVPFCLRETTHRYCYSGEQALENLLQQSEGYRSPAKVLKPREPIAEPIISQAQQEYNL